MTIVKLTIVKINVKMTIVKNLKIQFENVKMTDLTNDK